MQNISKYVNIIGFKDLKIMKIMNFTKMSDIRSIYARYFSENNKTKNNIKEVTETSMNEENKILKKESGSQNINQEATKKDIKKSIIEKTAAGSSDFTNFIVSTTFFVDKSLLIKEFLTSDLDAVLLTFPRRFGKSLNLGMIREFLRVKVNEKGETIVSTEIDSYKYFAGGTLKVDGKDKILKKLKIFKEKEIMDEYQGKFPVIYLDFKNINNFSSLDMVLELFKNVLMQAYKEHYYLKIYAESPSNDILNSNEKKFLKKFLGLYEYKDDL